MENVYTMDNFRECPYSCLFLSCSKVSSLCPATLPLLSVFLFLFPFFCISPFLSFCQSWNLSDRLRIALRLYPDKRQGIRISPHACMQTHTCTHTRPHRIVTWNHFHCQTDRHKSCHPWTSESNTHCTHRMWSDNLFVPAPPRPPPP